MTGQPGRSAQDQDAADSTGDQAPDAYILAAHRARLAPLDPLLAEPGPLPPPEGDDLLLTVPGGVGLVRSGRVDQDSFIASFTAAHDTRLAARVADTAALGALVDRWQELDVHHPGADDTATISWPSRDTEASGVFIDRGYTPQTVLAVRRAGFSMPDTPSDVIVRRAREGDMEAVVGLWVEETAWDQQFRSCVLRESTEPRIREDALEIFKPDGLWCWVAESSGEVVGMMVVQPPERAMWATGSLAPAPATYLTCGVVTARHRGGGVGYALVRAVHGYLDAQGAAASLLHYAAKNPLSVPFWSRCGYRPLTTSWTRGTIG